MENKTVTYDGREFALIYENVASDGFSISLTFAEIPPDGEHLWAPDRKWYC